MKNSNNNQNNEINNNQNGYYDKDGNYVEDSSY